MRDQMPDEKPGKPAQKRQVRQRQQDHGRGHREKSRKIGEGRSARRRARRGFPGRMASGGKELGGHSLILGANPDGSKGMRLKKLNLHRKRFRRAETLLPRGARGYNIGAFSGWPSPGS